MLWFQVRVLVGPPKNSTNDPRYRGTVPNHAMHLEIHLATLVKTDLERWKAVIRKAGWPTASKTFRTKRDAEDWARRAEDEMVRGAYIQRAPADRLTVADALKRYLAEVTPTKRPNSQVSDHNKRSGRPLPMTSPRSSRSHGAKTPPISPSEQSPLESGDGCKRARSKEKIGHEVLPLDRSIL